MGKAKDTSTDEEQTLALEVSITGLFTHRAVHLGCIVHRLLLPVCLFTPRKWPCDLREREQKKERCTCRQRITQVQLYWRFFSLLFYWLFGRLHPQWTPLGANCIRPFWPACSSKCAVVQSDSFKVSSFAVWLKCIQRMNSFYCHWVKLKQDKWKREKKEEGERIPSLFSWMSLLWLKWPTWLAEVWVALKVSSLKQGKASQVRWRWIPSFPWMALTGSGTVKPPFGPPARSSSVHWSKLIFHPSCGSSRRSSRNISLLLYPLFLCLSVSLSFFFSSAYAPSARGASVTHGPRIGL